ncbi:MAG: TIGR01777 family oxidoreductase [Pseudomonadota bacterium]
MERNSKHVLIGGGSGFIGSALADALRARGDRVTVLSRTPGVGRITWEDVSERGIPACDAVVNLAGEHILQPGKRWTAGYRDEVIKSRVDTTRTLVDAINAHEAPPEVFVSTAGKCFYGTRSMAPGQAYPELDEDSQPMGMDFPAELVGQWETAADHLDHDRVRHVRVRIGIVLGAVRKQSFLGRLWRIGRARGVLPLVRLPFCLGLGARFGSGMQPFPWIHIDDMVGILLHVIDHPETDGRYNAVSPGIVSNRDFTAAFGRSLRRPVVWSVPAWLVNVAIGQERASILLEGQNVVPKRTLAAGYSFRYPTIDGALEDLVEITI